MRVRTHTHTYIHINLDFFIYSNLNKKGNSIINSDSWYNSLKINGVEHNAKD